MRKSNKGRASRGILVGKKKNLKVGKLEEWACGLLLKGLKKKKMQKKKY